MKSCFSEFINCKSAALRKMNFSTVIVKVFAEIISNLTLRFEKKEQLLTKNIFQ